MSRPRRGEKLSHCICQLELESASKLPAAILFVGVDESAGGQ